MNQRKFYSRMESQFQNRQPFIMWNSLKLFQLINSLKRFLKIVILLLQNALAWSCNKFENVYEPNFLEITDSLPFFKLHCPHLVRQLFWSYGLFENLSELMCHSGHNLDLLHQLSQLCHRIESLNVILQSEVSNELSGLISVQRNLKELNVFSSDH